MNKLLLLLANICLLANIALSQSITHGPVTGSVTQYAAKVVFFADQGLSAQLRYSKTANFSTYDSVSATTDPSNGNVLKFVLQNLESNTRYYHQAYLNGSPAADVATFKTKPCDGESGNFSFHIGSCQNENRSNDEVYQEMLNHPADFFLQLGDWGYPDDTDNLPNNNDFFPADYNRVIEAYKNKYDYQYMKEYLKTTWIDYVWDDHDYVDDNSSKNTSSYTDFGLSPTLLEIPFPPGTRRNAIKGYYDLFPAFEPVDSSEGTYHKFRYGNIEVFMLDNRASRSPVNDAIQLVNGDYVYAPPPGHTILGEIQRDWLLENLKKSTATWKFIATATAFNKSYRNAIQGVLNLPNLAGLPLASALVDCWSGYPMDQDSIIDMVNREKIDGVIMMSGDTHTTGIDDGQAGGLPEIMAGCLSQTNSALFTTVPLLAFGLTWSEGGQGIGGNLNTKTSFGKISTNGDNSVTLEVIDKDGGRITDYTLYSCSYYSGLDLQAINIEDSKCFGDSTGSIEVQASGGTAPYSYTLDREIYQSSPIFSGLSKGKYTLAVKDATGCTKELCISIEQPDSISVEIDTYSALCNGDANGQAFVQANGGTGAFSYHWPDSSVSLAFDTNLLAGNYQVSIEDANQCVKTKSFTISEPDALNYIAITEDVNCFDGSDGIATIVPTGGVNPIGILWNDSVTTFTNNQLDFGYQSFTIKDSNACTLVDSVFIDQADSLYINPIITADNGNRTGSIILNPQGGTAPYLYQWQGPSRSDTLRNLNAGSYTLNLIDANGCLLKTAVEVPFDSVSVNIEEIENQKMLSVYPNPASTVLQIEWKGKELPEHIEIFDLKGQSIWANPNVNSTSVQRVDVSNWASGIYIVSIQINGKNISKRFVVND